MLSKLSDTQILVVLHNVNRDLKKKLTLQSSTKEIPMKEDLSTGKV